MRICYDDFNVRKFVIGSGGSAFSDGGLGAVQALNVFDFYDKHGRLIDAWPPACTINEADLVLAEARVRDAAFLQDVSVLMPCDVTSPLLGPAGASHVFGPQKGATAEQIPILDCNIEHTIRLYLRALHGDDQKFDDL